MEPLPRQRHGRRPLRILKAKDLPREQRGAGVRTLEFVRNSWQLIFGALRFDPEVFAGPQIASLLFLLNYGPVDGCHKQPVGASVAV